MKPNQNSLWSLVAIAATVIVFGSLSSATARQLAVEGRGELSGSQSWLGGGLDKASRQKLLTLAEVDAMNRYAAGFSTAKFALYKSAQQDIAVHIGDYEATPVVVSEGYDKASHAYVMVIRAYIDTDEVDQKLNSGVSSSPIAQRRISLSFLFVARSTASVKTFDKRVTSVTVNKANASARQSQSLSGGVGQLTSTSNNTSESITGGNTVRQADQISYAVSSPEDMNTAMTQVLTDNGFNVYDYRDVSAQCGGPAPKAIYKEFSNANMLGRRARLSVFNTARRCQVNTFAIGTLDVGLQDTDPVTGMKRVYVSVRAQVDDLSGLLPRLIASVGPVQYAGLGPNQQVATRNALLLAAHHAAEEISNQLKSRGMQ